MTSLGRLLPGSVQIVLKRPIPILLPCPTGKERFYSRYDVTGGPIHVQFKYYASFRTTVLGKSFLSQYCSHHPLTKSCDTDGHSDSTMSPKNDNQLATITAGIAAIGLAYGISGHWDSEDSSFLSFVRYQLAGSGTNASQMIDDTVCNKAIEDENQNRRHSCFSSGVGDHSCSSVIDENQSRPKFTQSVQSNDDGDDEDNKDGDGGVAADFFIEKNEDQSFQIFSGTSNPELAREICSHLGMSMGRTKIGKFSDGEVTLEILDKVRGKDVFVVQSVPSAASNISPHSSLMELFFLIAALKRASAKRVTAVLPYMSYFRQTTQMDQSKPLAAADMGLLLTTMGVDRVVFVDVHTKRVEGFFPPIPITKRKQELGRSVVIVSTDNSGTEKAKAFMWRMQRAGFEAGMATLLSNRPERPQKEAGALVVNLRNDIGVVCSGSPARNETNKTEDWLVGEVAGKDCIIVDDIIDTGERGVNAAYALKSAGARRVYMYATHGLFSRGAIDRIIKSPIRELVVTDTIRLPDNLYCEKLRVISISLLLAEAIRRIHFNQPLSGLYRDSRFDRKISSAHYHQ